jgi:hypothetical protein
LDYLLSLPSAYVWGGGLETHPKDRIPACVAVPLHTVARELKTAPILSHMSNPDKQVRR